MNSCLRVIRVTNLTSIPEWRIEKSRLRPTATELERLGTMINQKLKFGKHKHSLLLTNHQEISGRDDIFQVDCH